MTDLLKYSALTLVLIGFELMYFKLAIRYQIIDRPNERSSHNSPTVRGAGIIFPFTILVWFAVEQMTPWFVLGTMLLAFISFIDDLKTVPSGLRLIMHIVAMALLFYQLSLGLLMPSWIIAILFVISVGILSAFNFMDGINGITGIYALVALATFWFIHNQQLAFTDTNLIVMLGLAVLIFLFFNFRQQAVCFAGDVGSITLAFFLCFFLLQLITTTGNFNWIVLFAVYGIDSVITILFRISRKENIFQPHRTHLFQYLSNEMNWSHQIVSVVYGGVQLLINVLFIWYIQYKPWYATILFLLFSIGLYLIIRINVIATLKDSTTLRTK